MSGPLPASISPVISRRTLLLGSTIASGESEPKLKVTALNAMKTRNAVPNSSEPYSGQWSLRHQECFCMPISLLLSRLRTSRRGTPSFQVELSRTGCCAIAPVLDEQRCLRAGQYLVMCATSPFWLHGNHRFGHVQPSLRILAKLSLFRALVELKLAESGSAFATLIPSDLCFLSPRKRVQVITP